MHVFAFRASIVQPLHIRLSNFGGISLASRQAVELPDGRIKKIKAENRKTPGEITRVEPCCSKRCQGTFDDRRD